MVIRVIGGYQDGAPQLLCGKRSDLYHSEMSCATFGLCKVPLARRPTSDMVFPPGTFRIVN